MEDQININTRLEDGMGMEVEILTSDYLVIRISPTLLNYKIN